MLTDLHFTVAPTLAWNESWAAWLRFEYVKRGGGELAPKSLENYLQDARHLAEWFEDAQGMPFSPDLLTPEIVRAYFAWQEERKDRPNSRNRRLASLRILVKWCLAMGVLDRDPTLRQERARQQRLPRRAKDPAEMQALAAAAASGSHLRRHTARYGLLGARDRILWSLFRHTGMRISEIAGLDVGDLDLSARRIRVMGKGGVEGEVLIDDGLLSDLNAWLAVRPGPGIGALVTDWNGRRISACQIRRRLQAIGQAAGVKVNPHDLRHTGIERVMAAAQQEGMPFGKALQIGQDFARHADKRTTLGYLRPTYDEMFAVINAAGRG